MKAYVLINVRSGKALEVVSKVRLVAGVNSASACWGRPDIFALVEAKDDETLAGTVLTKIQTIGGIESTDTHIVID